MRINFFHYICKLEQLKHNVSYLHIHDKAFQPIFTLITENISIRRDVCRPELGKIIRQYKVYKGSVHFQVVNSCIRILLFQISVSDKGISVEFKILINVSNERAATACPRSSLTKLSRRQRPRLAINCASRDIQSTKLRRNISLGI